MVRAPDPIHIVHFTHLENLQGIVQNGLRSDALCRRGGLTEVEIGSATIRERRLSLPVGNVGPRGCVGDYVPWYFGPRSPMMFTLNRNNYEFRQGFDEVVYLVSTVPLVINAGVDWIASDRNAALGLAEFTDREEDLVDHVSWDVIAARYWGDFQDGADLRAAEFLAYEMVPWNAIAHIVTRKRSTAERVKEMLAGQLHSPSVSVRPGWYF